MKAYCVPISALKSGQPVPKSLDFFEALKKQPNKKAVEDILESVRPANLPKRDSTIYLFENESHAKEWAATKKRPLYLAELSQKDVLFKADWCWLQIIMYAIKSAQANEMARNYWDGKPAPTPDPWWELLVASATVVEEIVIPDKVRFQLRTQQKGMPNFSS